MDPGFRTVIMRPFRTRPRTLKVCKPLTTEQNTETIFSSWDPCDRCPRRPMALTLDALGIVAIASAIGWWAVGIVSAVRSRVASPFDRALATASFLIGALAFVTPYASVSVGGPLADLRLTFIALATLLVLLATKWISRGHSRYHALLAVPAIASLTVVSAIQERVTAIYMFYRTGEPLVALASNRSLPIEAEQLEAVLSVVGNFVETSVPSSRGYAVTAMRYEGLGLVAVRGEFVIIAAVYDGPAYDALRSELTRTLKVFEERSWKELRTWEDATKVAETAAVELSNLLYRPERTAPPSLPRASTGEAKPGKFS